MKCGAVVVWAPQPGISGILPLPAFGRVKEADYFFQSADAHLHRRRAFSQLCDKFAVVPDQICVAVYAFAVRVDFFFQSL
ncbi:MAG: hypothetical protein F4Y89_08780, partial [Gammaproteobacteria bacterium]|nr:hypothetical protein [Gammaproteobacteria bacterium]